MLFQLSFVVKTSADSWKRLWLMLAFISVHEIFGIYCRSYVWFRWMLIWLLLTM